MQKFSEKLKLYVNRSCGVQYNTSIWSKTMFNTPMHLQNSIISFLNLTYFSSLIKKYIFHLEWILVISWGSVVSAIISKNFWPIISMM